MKYLVFVHIFESSSVTMELVTSHVYDVAVLDGCSFATAFVPEKLPHYWEIVTSFAHEGTSTSCTPKDVEVMMGCLKMLKEKAFASDDSLVAGVNPHETN